MVRCKGFRPPSRGHRRILHKGSRVYLEGRKRTESWDDKQTGGKHYRDLVYVDKIEFLDSKGNGDANGTAIASLLTAARRDHDHRQDIPF